MKLTLLSLLALFLSACGGGTPASATVEGTWVDEASALLYCGLDQPNSVTLNLDQNGNDLSGTVRFVHDAGENSYDITYNLMGSVTNSGRVTGTLTFNSPGGLITYNADLQLDGDTLSGTFVNPGSAPCGDNPTLVVNAQRQ